ncbi:hypothetical protein GCM10027277_48860 [Pseudoduganella ginsengisoli]
MPNAGIREIQPRFQSYPVKRLSPADAIDPEQLLRLSESAIYVGKTARAYCQVLLGEEPIRVRMPGAINVCVF